MVFSSLTFLLYFLPLTLIIYYLLSFSIPVQNIWLLLMSLLFYTWGEPAYFWLLIVSTLINYLLGLLVGKFLDTKPKAAKFEASGIKVGSMPDLRCTFTIEKPPVLL